MTIISSINQIIFLPLMGLASGAQPIISYNFGANQFDRVKKTFKLLLTVCLVYTTVMCVSLELAPHIFVNIFNDKPELVEITSHSIRIFFAGIFIFGAQSACQQTFLALGQAKISLVLALLRKMILLVPLIFILPATTASFISPLDAVFLAEPIADIIAAKHEIRLGHILLRRILKFCIGETNPGVGTDIVGISLSFRLAAHPLAAASGCDTCRLVLRVHNV